MVPLHLTITMTVETLTQTVVFVLSLLTVFGNLLILSLVIGWANEKTIKLGIISKYSRWLRKELPENSLLFAWLVALIATLGSLYFSEIAGWIPCKFCWFQRIFMYPLSIVLGIAHFRKDLRIRTYVIPLALIGALISAYHYALQRISILQAYSVCDATADCAVPYTLNFGYITVPFMALTAFILVALFLSLRSKA